MEPPKNERCARGAGFTIGLIFKLTKIDRWFLVQIKEIVDFEEELAGRVDSWQNLTQGLRGFRIVDS
ncbi:MAG: hypothetical protein ABSF10_20720 [Verrucomicrobiota bacterium]